MPSDFVDIQYLSTFASMVIVLGLIVQFTKGLVKRSFSDQAVRAYAFVWALIIVTLVGWYNGHFDVIGREIAIVVLLILINAIILTLAAMGGYELISNPKALKSRDSGT